ncbi:hypothetical protein [Citrobacter freundii]
MAVGSFVFDNLATAWLDVLRKVKTRLAGRGFVTAKAVTLFSSSLRCGASGVNASHALYRA